MRNSKTRAIFVPQAIHTKNRIYFSPQTRAPSLLFANLSNAPISPQELSLVPRRVSLTTNRILLTSTKFESCQFPALGKHQASHGSLLQDHWKLMAIHELSELQHDPFYFIFFSRMIQEKGEKEKTRKAFSRDISTIPLMATETGPKSNSNQMELDFSLKNPPHVE